MNDVLPRDSQDEKILPKHSKHNPKEKNPISYEIMNTNNEIPKKFR